MAIRGAIAFAAAATMAVAAGAFAGSMPAGAQTCPGNPDAIGTSRVIAISPADYPRVGTIQYRQTLPLDDHEVVLTFDDGPLPPYSTQILDILAANCAKALFFNIGSMARAYPTVTRRVHDDGHTLGTHSENHPLRFGELPLDKMREEIDQGIADVGAAAGDPKAVAPFFRVPGLARSDLLEQELAARSLAVFSADAVADDWHRRISPAKIVSLALSRLEARGKGILLLHDIHPWTVAALPALLKELKAHGFRIVQVMPAGPDEPETIATLPGVTVAWTMAAQDVMDDAGAAPGWPSLELSSLAGPVALPAPDLDALGVSYTFSRPLSTAEIETASAAPDLAGAVAAWPEQHGAELSPSPPQLSAPSLQDLGWPVAGRIIAAKEIQTHASNAADGTAPAITRASHGAHAQLRHAWRHARPQGRPVAHSRTHGFAGHQHA